MSLDPPLDLFAETRALAAALEAAGVGYALVGAVALAIHGAPRATTDLDLLVRREDLERAIAQARELGFTIEALPMRFSDGMEIRRLVKIAGEETLTLDLILVDTNLEEVWASRQRVETGFGAVWVISRPALIQMKAWAGREQDLADIRRLEEIDR